MQNVEFDSGQCSGTKYFEMKYFLSDNHKHDKIKENFAVMAQRNNQIVATPVDNTIIMER